MAFPRHGGPRHGAGRKPGSGMFGEPTRVVRVPESQVHAVMTFLETRRATPDADQSVRILSANPIQPGRKVRVPLMPDAQAVRERNAIHAPTLGYR